MRVACQWKKFNKRKAILKIISDSRNQYVILDTKMKQ